MMLGRTEKSCGYVFILDLGSGTIHPILKRKENRRSKINGTSRIYSIGKNRKPLNSTAQSSGGLSLQMTVMDHPCS